MTARKAAVRHGMERVELENESKVEKFSRSIIDGDDSKIVRFFYFLGCRYGHMYLAAGKLSACLLYFSLVDRTFYYYKVKQSKKIRYKVKRFINGGTK